MISNEVEHMMQLQMNKPEATLFSWAMKLAIDAICDEPSVEEGLKTMVAIAQAVRDLGMEGTQNFLDRFTKLAEAAFPNSLTDTVEIKVAGIWADPETCPHCPCTDPVCCCCGARKDGLD